MTLALWVVLASGKFRSDAEEEKRGSTGEMGRAFRLGGADWHCNENAKRISQPLERGGRPKAYYFRSVGAWHIFSLATTNGAFCITYVFPILGGRKVEHLLANLEALDISISDEQIKCLESIISFDVGFHCERLGII